MSANALSNSLFAAAASQTVATQLTNSPQSQATAAGTAVPDTVALSATAQANVLHQEGLSVQEIADSLELTTAEVDSYLGITTTTSSGGGSGGGGAPAGGAHAVAQAAPAGGNASSSSTAQTIKGAIQAAGSTDSLTNAPTG